MLASKRFPEILRSILSDGVDGAMIMTVEGSILAADFANTANEGSDINETQFAALSSSIWHNYLQASTVSSCDVACFVAEMEKGSVAIAPVGKAYIVSVYGNKVPLGLLKGRVEALSQYFTRVFDQLK